MPKCISLLKRHRAAGPDELPPGLFKDGGELLAIHYVSRNGSQFTCPVGSYFQCMASQSSKLTKPSSVKDPIVQPEVFVTLSDLKAEAFRSGNTPTFVGSMRECSADYVPNKVVPIVVGVALAAMIIIALITSSSGGKVFSAKAYSLDQLEGTDVDRA
ncbi:hypothetical protein T265_00868 [Opisthorchis viverrini]|uniref:Uncharacterized protein n=1 Tax=Opisthorchis viverrini TaxID=6198 RepID=A0A075AJD0_OPIVI|nr:hypothetical protein T265_00868 [Opisthorchis viverrini]KER33169.1 hypothetical protein T265_00868 [Opisthorchis viverrini]